MIDLNATVTRELRTGWIASAAFHLLLLLLFVFFSLPEAIRAPQEVEMAWGMVASEIESSPAGGLASDLVPRLTDADASLGQNAAAAPSVPLDLPERRSLDPSTETLRSLPRDKQGIEPDAVGATTGRQTGTAGERTARGAIQRGAAERGTGVAPGASAGRFAGSGQEGPGTGVGKGVGYSLEWTNGGTRKKLSGDLPKYPEGTNVEAQIRILAVVTPDGNVRSVQPAQRANARLEDAAMRELRLWRFEPLPSGAPQVDQSCVVSFQFRLK